jgi:hypothetical protein
MHQARNFLFNTLLTVFNKCGNKRTDPVACTFNHMAQRVFCRYAFFAHFASMPSNALGSSMACLWVQRINEQHAM